MEFDAEHRTLVSAGLFSEQAHRVHVLHDIAIHAWRKKMGRGILLWLLGVPIPVIILLWLFFGR
ncbi:MAG: hypothetical protein ACRCTX_01415 [Afipia sp.]